MREEKTDKKKNSEREARNEGKHEVRPREGKVESDTDRQTERGGSEVVQWLTVRPQGSWQARLHATCRKQRVIVV